jgi:hypothetical protein
MGNACLGEPRRNAQLMRRKDVPELRYISAKDPKVK